MPFIPTSVTRNQEHRIGKIISVKFNQTQTYSDGVLITIDTGEPELNQYSPPSILMEDKYGGQFMVSMHVHDTVATIPAVGEVWLVKRMGVDWVLDKRLDNKQERIPIGTLDAGDRRLEANKDLHLAGTTVNAIGDNVTVSGSLDVYSHTHFHERIVLDVPLEPKYIEPSTTENYVLTTVSGVATWAESQGGTGGSAGGGGTDLIVPPWIYINPVAPCTTPKDYAPSDVTFKNNWKNAGDPYGAVAFRIFAGRLEIKGHVNYYDADNGTVMFTLPSQYRPSYTVTFPAALSIGGLETYPQTTTGKVIIDSATGDVIGWFEDVF